MLLFGNAFLLFLEEPHRSRAFGLVFAVVLVSGLFLGFSRLKKRSIQIVGEQKKVDERDVIFARFDQQESSDSFHDYYRRRPELRKIDDEIRKIPDILTLSHTQKDPWHFSLAAGEFDFLEHQITDVDGKVGSWKLSSLPSDNSRRIKEIIRYLGSEACGICRLNQAYVYSHVGRGPELYGKKVELVHAYAVVFAVEMDFGMIRAAPHPAVIVETAKQYIQAARISIVLAHMIRRLGYPARAHIAGSNYQAVIPPLGWEAGLGELGRLGILITSRYGPRARLGLVTTDLPLEPDGPRTLGIQNFCEKCQKCARNCPAQAIPSGEKTEENGVLKWVLKREECYRFWRKVGTDCALCIAVCPYSKPDHVFHSLIRRMTERSSSAQSLAIRGDDFFYGRFPRHHRSCLRL
ncbi:MAG: 4Fe-4S dicluster domain-containing protein [Candidatus Aminicenantales bacterium]